MTSRSDFKRDRWPTNRGPVRTLLNGGRARVLEHLVLYPTWADHQYVSEDRTEYVCCPYGLNGDAIADLDFLKDNGWDVTISAYDSFWGNGTLQVTITRCD